MGSRFQKAVREKLNLRMAIDGPSGSGKSYTAQRIAMLLAQEYKTRVAVIDAENNSARKYIGEAPDGIPFEFNDLNLTSYSPTEYTSAIIDAEKEGHGVLVIDQLSHAWSGKDGALELVDKQGKNKFTDGWKTVTPMHNRMIEAILSFKGHVIVTMRSKTEYIIEEDEKGKKVPRKVALAPIQRQGMEYEFDIYGSMDWSHVMTITKSRCPSLDGLVMVKPGAALVSPIVHWLNTGEAGEPVGGARLLRIDDAMLAELTEKAAAKGLKGDALKLELTKRYQIERLADLTPSQAKDFMLKRLCGGRAIAGSNNNTAASKSAPTQVVTSEGNEGDDTGAGDEGAGGAQGEAAADEPTVQVADVLANAMANPAATIAAAKAKSNSTYISDDDAVSKPTLAALNRAITRYVKAGNTQDAITKAIRKRNERATTPGDLTEGQADNLLAALLKKLDGPHEVAPTTNPQ